MHIVSEVLEWLPPPWSDWRAEQEPPTHHARRPLTYREIAVDLAERIKIGEYPPGTSLPKLRELARIYSVSVATVQRALIFLEGSGAVRGERGRGVFVVEAPHNS